MHSSSTMSVRPLVHSRRQSPSGRRKCSTSTSGRLPREPIASVSMWARSWPRRSTATGLPVSAKYWVLV